MGKELERVKIKASCRPWPIAGFLRQQDHSNSLDDVTKTFWDERQPSRFAENSATLSRHSPMRSERHSPLNRCRSLHEPPSFGKGNRTTGRCSKIGHYKGGQFLTQPLHIQGLSWNSDLPKESPPFNVLPGTADDSRVPGLHLRPSWAEYSLRTRCSIAYENPLRPTCRLGRMRGRALSCLRETSRFLPRSRGSARCGICADPSSPCHPARGDLLRLDRGNFAAGQSQPLPLRRHYD